MSLTALAEASPSPALQRARGEGRVIANVQDGTTEIAALYQEGCAKIRLPHTHDASLQAVLMNTAGGLCGGDHIRWTATAKEQARLVVTTPACERVYRSADDSARIENRLVAEAGAHLDWLPQETILYEGAQLSRTLEVDLAPDATFTGVETILLGRQAMGESAPNAKLRDSWRVRRGGKLIHAEATLLTTDPAERKSSSLLAGMTAFATLLHISPTAERQLDSVRALLPETGGASLIGDKLTVRLMAESGLALRRALAPIIALLSSAGSLPRLWSL